MSEAQTATPDDARQASESRVTTQETLLESMQAPEAASAPTDEQSDASKQEEVKAKHSAQDRIRALAAQRNAALQDKAALQQEADELRAKVKALEARAAPMQEEARPDRSKFYSDDEYIDAVSDWKARQAIANREREAQAARLKAEADAALASWNRKQETIAKEIPDYIEVVGASQVDIADYVRDAIMESDSGPQIAYYLALNPAEAQKLNEMRPVAAIKHLAEIERAIADDKPEPQKVPKTKAPEPITPVKQTAAAMPAGPASSFAEYKRRRQSK